MTASRASRPDPRYGWGIPSVSDAVNYPAIEGVVRDLHTGEPIPNATVRWEPAVAADSTASAPSDSPPRGATTSGATGEYLIPNLPNGSYVLRVDAPGYFESISAALEMPPSLEAVNFSLRYQGE
ncbi:MAG TPA: carboxypeptidase-like regulatory domain-containing protein, partial [Candidatus Eisenbacteria bacterium]|nr:carboxypeptidase-like regulatory domain-containing protein [Candidatus Eisenbacteria bacterium]